MNNNNNTDQIIVKSVSDMCLKAAKIDEVESALYYQPEADSVQQFSKLHNSQLVVNNSVTVDQIIRLYFCLLQYPFYLYSKLYSILILGPEKVPYYDVELDTWMQDKAINPEYARSAYINFCTAFRFRFLVSKRTQPRWYELYENELQKIYVESHLYRTLNILIFAALVLVPYFLILKASL